MNFKSIAKGLMAGAMSLALAGSAFAAAMPDINLYGASAQFTFWRQMAPLFLTAKNCTDVQCSQATSADFIARGHCGDTSNYSYFRVSSKASWEGPCSVTGSNDSNCLAGCAINGGAVDQHNRLMANESASGIVWGACQTTPPISYSNTGAANKCVTINVGASDVNSKNFNELSDGCTSGPNNVATNCDQANGSAGILPATDWVHRAFTSSGIDTTGYYDCQPLVVPFALYANNSVMKNGAPIQNMSRIMAVFAFSGQFTKWTDFGPQYTLAATSFDGQPCDTVNTPIVTCYRHAGSGTAAAFDHVIMHAAWGSPVVSFENPVVFNGNKITSAGSYFNDGTGAMMACVNGGKFKSQGYDANFNYVQATEWSGCGAIGYADADWLALNQKTPAQCAADATQAGCMTHQLTYQGEQANRQNVRDDVYEYWTNQHLYMAANPGATLTNLCTWANARSNVDNSGTEAGYWATQCEMKNEKASDKDYPSVSAAHTTCGRIGD